MPHVTDRFVVGVVAGAIGLIGGMAANSALLALSANTVQINRKPVYRTGLECHDGNSHGLEPPPASNLILIGLPHGLAAAESQARAQPAH
jgi:hypothetical protein